MPSTIFTTENGQDCRLEPKTHLLPSAAGKEGTMLGSPPDYAPNPMLTFFLLPTRPAPLEFLDPS